MKQELSRNRGVIQNGTLLNTIQNVSFVGRERINKIEEDYTETRSQREKKRCMQQAKELPRSTARLTDAFGVESNQGFLNP